MNVIHVTHDAGRYGISTFLIHLIRFQKIHNKNVNVAIAFHSYHDEIKKYYDLGIPVYCLNRKNARDVRLFFGFINAFKKADIVNLHTFSPWAFLAAVCLRKKIVFTFHGTFGIRGKIEALPLKLYYRWGINRFCDRITFATETSYGIYRNKIKGVLPRHKIEIFLYGLEIDEIRSLVPKKQMRSLLEIDQAFLIGTAVRFDPVKRLELLVDAVAGMGDHANIVLLIAGAGNDDYREFIVKRVRDRSLEDQVHFLGYRKDILEILNTLDVFVLPSVNETFGLALLEALALGIPCVVFSDGGGVLDILGDCGHIVRNVKELTAVLIELKTNDPLRENLSRRGKERARQFDIRLTAEHFQRIYQGILGS